jgi:hypothetical protein
LLPEKEAAVAAEGTGPTVGETVTSDNNVDSQQRQWQEQATAVETEAAAGSHNNQPTDGSNSSRNGARSGGSSNGSSCGSSSGDDADYGSGDSGM